MTVTTSTVTCTVDGVTVEVPAGTLIIRVAEMLGTAIPRFCDHPLLDAVAACRMCLVEIEGQPKPQPSCAVPVTEGMVIKTQHTSEVAAAAQAGVMEFLLINHPLDCPVCDKGGECPLQNQAMTSGRGDTRFTGVKRTFPKPINVSAQVLLDRERCVSCARCTRFADQIAGDPFIELLERGAKQQVGISQDQPFDSYFSGNTIQICPVGALTSAKYRFRSRPFDLVSTPTACEHCASGCALRTDVRRGQVMRRLAWDAPEVNEEWNCDKGRFAFPYAIQGRLTSPLVRDTDGNLVPASWPEAIRTAAAGLAQTGPKTGVLTGGRLTHEDAKAYAAFARNVLGTGDVDFRARAVSDEETAFLASYVAGKTLDVTYADLEVAPAVLMVGFEPEDESPIVFLRLRKAARTNGTKVYSIAPYATAGLGKVNGTLIPAAPHAEPTAVANSANLLTEPGSIILVGERAATIPGLLTAVAQLTSATGAKLAWIPRRAGDRGALDAGLLPVTGRNTEEIIDAVGSDITGLVIAGVEAHDLVADLEGAIERADFVVSLETRHSEVTAIADVVFPVATVIEKSGTFRNWEGRDRSFTAVAPKQGLLSDADVLAEIATAMSASLELTEDFWDTANKPVLSGTAVAAPVLEDGQVELSSWRHLLDNGTLQDGEPYLAATSRVAVIRVSANTATRLGLTDGDYATVDCAGVTATAPVIITNEMVDGVVWLPANSQDATLNLPSGYVVSVTTGGKP
ncbi:MAG: NADH-quinone oxidoreductase subunit G [Actinobacteria bacterium]|nr:NADH-quinone oxidoreductase subunit G [Actinomycetota bacterium]NBY16030.1 NADH-quinone oxidoreductase subunit G [Actinomycetota bacterium]